MECFHFFAVFALLCLVAGSNASLPAEEYWRAMLPNTPLPNVLRELIVSDGYTGNRHISMGTVTENWNILYGIFNYAATTSQFDKSAIPNTIIFFLYNDLHTNTRMRLDFTKSTNKAVFLPNQIAASVPFSSDQLSEILNHFSVSSGSVEAKIMKRTIQECEQPSIQGEEKHCATSLESLIDFNIAKLGKNVRVLSTEVQREAKEQEYVVSSGIKRVGDNAVICHKQRYPYAVYYCHSINGTRVHVVPLESEDGSKIKAVAICHMDTSAWNANHLAFRVLKVNPGPSICHFPGSDTLIWFSN